MELSVTFGGQTTMSQTQSGEIFSPGDQLKIELHQPRGQKYSVLWLAVAEYPPLGEAG